MASFCHYPAGLPFGYSLLELDEKREAEASGFLSVCLLVQGFMCYVTFLI